MSPLCLVFICAPSVSVLRPAGSSTSGRAAYQLSVYLSINPPLVERRHQAAAARLQLFVVPNRRSGWLTAQTDRSQTGCLGRTGAGETR